MSGAEASLIMGTMGKAMAAKGAADALTKTVGGGQAWGPAARENAGLQAMSAASPAMQQNMLDKVVGMAKPHAGTAMGLLGATLGGEEQVDPRTTFRPAPMSQIQMQQSNPQLAYNLLDILRSNSR